MFTVEEIRAKVLQVQAWTERAILAIDARDGWRKEDKRLGNYLAEWIKGHSQTPIGERITGDEWEGKARALVQKYASDLLIISYGNTLRKISIIEDKLRHVYSKAEKLELRANRAWEEAENVEKELQKQLDDLKDQAISIKKEMENES